MSRTAILIPSLGRSQHVKRVHGNIEANTIEPHTQWWIVGDDGYEEELVPLIPGNATYYFDDDPSDTRYVTRMNQACRAILSANTFGEYSDQPDPYEYVFFGSDDVVHHPFWLSKAIEVMESAKDAAVVVVNDLRNPNGTQALVRTSYLPLAVFDDPSAAFHHGYQHNFADTEMFQTAAQRGVIYRAMESHVEHLHPLHQGPNQRQWDETYANAQRQWDVDAKLFHERMILMKEALGG